MKYEKSITYVVSEGKAWCGYEVFEIDVYKLEFENSLYPQLLKDLMSSPRYKYSYLGEDRSNLDQAIFHGPYWVKALSEKSYQPITFEQAYEKIETEFQTSYDYLNPETKAEFISEGNVPPFSKEDGDWLQNVLFPLLRMANQIYLLDQNSPHPPEWTYRTESFVELIIITNDSLWVVALFTD